MPRLKVVHMSNEVLAIICDSELIGKEFREGELKLKVDESFYGGEEASVEDCFAAMRRATIANMVGSIVEHAIDAGLVDPSNVIWIQNVPHAQIVKI